MIEMRSVRCRVYCVKCECRLPSVECIKIVNRMHIECMYTVDREGGVGCRMWSLQCGLLRSLESECQ